MAHLNRSSFAKNISPTISTTTDVIIYQTYAERQLISTLLAIISIVAFFGNSLVVIAVILSKKLRTFTNAFVVNLSVADLLTALNLPWLVTGVLSVDGWPLPDQLCVMCAFMLVCCLGCSATTLAFIAFNRLVLITRPKSTFRWLYTRRKVCIMLVFTWAFPATFATIPLVSPIGELGFDTRYFTCSWKTSNPYTGMYSILLSTAFYPVQLFVIIVSYVQIILYLRKHTKNIVPDDAPSAWSVSGNTVAENPPSETGVQTRIRKRQADVTKNLLYVVCCYLMCLTPYTVVMFIPTSYEAVMYVTVILFSNSCINPFIYATKHPDFKKVFKCILCLKLKDVPWSHSVDLNVDGLWVLRKRQVPTITSVD